jgi:hypothetical protein
MMVAMKDKKRRIVACGRITKVKEMELFENVIGENKYTHITKVTHR